MKFELKLTDANGALVHRWSLEPDGRGGVETHEGGAIHNRVGTLMKEWEEVEELKKAAPDAPVPDSMFRALNEREDAAMREWARANHRVGEPVNEFWHPVARSEAEAMNAAARTKTGK